MSVVEFRNQISFVERVFYTLFCKLVNENYCGYPIKMEDFSKKLELIREEFLNIELEHIIDIFATEQNFITFILNETHHKNKGYYDEEQNKLFLLLGQEEIDSTLEANQDILELVNNLYKILSVEKISTRKLTKAC